MPRAPGPGLPNIRLSLSPQVCGFSLCPSQQTKPMNQTLNIPGGRGSAARCHRFGLTRPGTQELRMWGEPRAGVAPGLQLRKAKSQGFSRRLGPPPGLSHPRPPTPRNPWLPERGYSQTALLNPRPPPRPAASPPWESQGSGTCPDFQRPHQIFELTFTSSQRRARTSL